MININHVLIVVVLTQYFAIKSNQTQSPYPHKEGCRVTFNFSTPTPLKMQINYFTYLPSIAYQRIATG